MMLMFDFPFVFDDQKLKVLEFKIILFLFYLPQLFFLLVLIKNIVEFSYVFLVQILN